MSPIPAGVIKSKRRINKDVPVPGNWRTTRSQSKLTPSTIPTQTTAATPSVHSAKMPYTTIPESSSNSTPKASNTTKSTSTSTFTYTKPIFFWRPNQPGGYLGQWFPSPFTVDGDTYATAEMWMMVQKARLFNDESVAKQMLATENPRTHKALGRKVKGFQGDVWDEHKLRIVEEGTYQKFTISEDAENLRNMLLATGERELVEASPMDRIWGVGFVEKDAGANRRRWGENLLGKALVIVRERLREESEKEKKKVGE